MANVKTIEDAVRGGRSIRLYGVQLSGLTNPDAMINAGAAKVELAQIRAFAFGNYCREFPQPIMLLLPATAKDVEDGDKCGIPKLESFWTVLSTAEIGVLSIDSGAAHEVLESVSSRGISGGFTIDRVWIDNGRLCVTFHAWARIEIFGASAGFDERPTVCVPMEGCRTVWEIGIARIDVCVNANREVCAKLCVGKWGLEKCWDVCTAIPLTAKTSGKTECDCKAA